MSDSTAERPEQTTGAKILRFPTLDGAPGGAGVPKDASSEQPSPGARRPVPARGEGLRRRTLLRAAEAAQQAAQKEAAQKQAAQKEATSGAAPWQRIASLRRRRSDKGERHLGDEQAPAGQATSSAGASAPASAAQVVTWLLNLRRGGVGSLYWNAAKLPIDVAIIRAARLDDEAHVDVAGHRLLVIEPMRRPVHKGTSLAKALRAIADDSSETDPGLVVP